MLISAEFELPAVTTNNIGGLEAVHPDVFQKVWKELNQIGWERTAFGAHRALADAPIDCVSAEQVISTDSGPTIEIAPTPALSIKEIQRQLIDVCSILRPLLEKQNVILLGSGVNPALGTSRDEYYLYRTPRPAYDYAIKQRGWQHGSIINIAATQEVIDVPFEKSIRVLNFMYRIAGVILFLFRNDPDFTGQYGGRLSIRPEAWKRHVPYFGHFKNDRYKVCLPSNQITSWNEYLALLWENNPMFVLGTKNSGLVFIKDHPSFWEFITKAPAGGWETESIETGQRAFLQPEFNHLVQTDWTYMGFARLRWLWKDNVSLSDLISARQNGKIDEFFSENLKKVLIENRSTATQPPGEELSSLAFVVGLLAEFEKSEKLANSRPYSFWLALAHEAEFAPLRSTFDGVYVPALVRAFLEIALEGLASRNLDEKIFLLPLFQRLVDGLSPSERSLQTFKDGGMTAVIEKLELV